MMNNAKTKHYGLVGYPLGHSLSKVMHNVVFQSEFFKKTGLNCKYKNIEIKPEDFDRKIGELLSDENINGFNVTIPYKETIKKFARENEWLNSAWVVGAANTVKKCEDGSHKFYNTDWEGFLLSLEKFDLNLENKKVVLLGAGGAGKAIFAALQSSYVTISSRWNYGKVASLMIFDKDIEKANKIINHWSPLIKSFDLPRYNSETEQFCKKSIIVDDISKLQIENADILINTTPIGMKEGDPLLIDPKLLHKGLFVYDVIYNRETELIKAAKEKGLEAHNGLWMLILQGYRALEIWFGDIITSNKDMVLKTMEGALKEKGFIAC